MRQDKGAGQAQQKLSRPTSRKTCARHFPAEYAEKLEEMKAMQSRAWKNGLHSQSTLRAPPVPESEREGVQHMDGYPSVFDIVRPQRSLASLGQ